MPLIELGNIASVTSLWRQGKKERNLPLLWVADAMVDPRGDIWWR